MDRMDDLKLAYLGGAFDTGGSITFNIRGNQDTTHGYAMNPGLRLTGLEPTVEVLERLCQHLEIPYRWTDPNTKNRKRIDVNDTEAVDQLGKELYPYIIAKEPELELLLAEVLPRYRNGEQRSKDGFYTLLGYIDPILQSQSGGSRKYDLEYFYDEWADDLDLIPPDELRKRILQ